MDGEDGTASVVRAGEPELELVATELGFDGFQVSFGRLDGRLVVFLFGELQEVERLRGAALQSPPRLYPLAQGSRTLKQPARFIGIVPEVGVGGAIFEDPEFAFCSGDVKDAPVYRRCAGAGRRRGRCVRSRDQGSVRARHGVGAKDDGGSPAARSAARRVLTRSMAMVMGPTPPGTGVIHPATSRTAS